MAGEVGDAVPTGEELAARGQAAAAASSGSGCESMRVTETVSEDVWREEEAATEAAAVEGRREEQKQKPWTKMIIDADVCCLEVRDPCLLAARGVVVVYVRTAASNKKECFRPEGQEKRSRDHTREGGRRSVVRKVGVR